MCDDLAEILKDLAFQKLELLVSPKAEMTLRDVKIALKAIHVPIEYLQKDNQIILRFLKESQLKEALEYIESNTETLGLSAKRRDPPKPVKTPLEPEEEEEEEEGETPSDVDMYAIEEPPRAIASETFPIEAVASQMSKYVNCNTEPFRCITQPVPLTRNKIFKTGKSLLNRNVRIFKCRTCHRPTTHKCARTEIPFCSSECQKESLPVVAKESPPKTPEEVADVKGSHFILLHYTSARDLFLRAEKDDKEFIQEMNKIALHAKSFPNFKARCNIDQTVLAFYKGCWYRGRVTELIDKKTVRVLLLDLGHELPILFRQLKKPNEEVVNLNLNTPSTVVRCTLAGVKEDGMSYECEKIFESLIQEKTLLKALNGDFSALSLKADYKGIPKELNEMVNQAMTIEMDLNGASHFLKDLPENEINAVQENVPMLVTDFDFENKSLGLANGGYFKRCYQYECHFQKFPDQDRYAGNYTPRHLELVLVNVLSKSGTSRWLRAFGILNSGDRCPCVELLDYGTIVKVPVSSIRKMPKELLYPAASFPFYSEGNDSLDDTAKSWVKTNNCGLFPVVIPKILPADDENQHVRYVCPDLLNQMQSCMAA